MAAADGREGAGLIDALFRTPYRFDFFQAVRLCESLARERAGGDPERRRHPVGHDDPLREVASFRAQPSLAFPTSAINQFREVGGDDPLPEMVVTFLGLTGPSGVLPRHYTEMLIERIRERDHSLRDFLDLFHHRLVSLFFRAWEKYRLPVGYERSNLDDAGGEPDPVTGGLFALVGLATRGLRGRLAVDDEVFLHYSGHFAHDPRSALALECLLEDYLGVPSRVLQAQGQWLEIDPDDRAVMPGGRNPRGKNNQVGVNLTVGARVWDVQSKFRIRLGPLLWSQFRELMPDGDALRPLAHLTRLFVGPGLEFDVQPVLESAEVRPCRLDPARPTGAFLGWNTWLESANRADPVDDAVFAVQDL